MFIIYMYYKWFLLLYNEVFIKLLIYNWWNWMKNLMIFREYILFLFDKICLLNFNIFDKDFREFCGSNKY